MKENRLSSGWSEVSASGSCFLLEKNLWDFRRFCSAVGSAENDWMSDLPSRGKRSISFKDLLKFKTKSIWLLQQSMRLSGPSREKSSQMITEIPCIKTSSANLKFWPQTYTCICRVAETNQTNFKISDAACTRGFTVYTLFGSMRRSPVNDNINQSVNGDRMMARVFPVRVINADD